MTGCRPGDGFQYDGPTMQTMVFYTVSFETTHDAIDRLIMPPPLKTDRSRRAEVRVSYFVNRNNRAFDGQITPYQGFLFTAATSVNAVRGVAGWEYVDGLRGDKTEMDIMGAWSVYYGMLKKMADIRFLPLRGNEFEITVYRRGTRLVTMRLRLGNELSSDEVAAMNQADGCGFRTYTVREIPDSHYSGFVDRAIYWSGSEQSRIERAWAAEQGSIQFGHLDADPWDEMPVLGVTGATVFEMTVPKEVFHHLRLAEQLPMTASSEAVPVKA
jgi:hypothetical protein